MPTPYLALPAQRIVTPSAYNEPPELPPVIHITDDAATTFFNFEFHFPPVVLPEKSLEDARSEMDLFHLPVLIVVDKPNIIGIITAEDILGEKPVKLSQEKRIPRSEIEIGMLMTPITDVFAIQYDDLLHAKVGHIIQTLRDIQQHVFFVLKDAKIHGFFSASIISRQLNQDISHVMSEAKSIAELQHERYQ